jgi:predicted secreted acid phosphatase
MDKFLLDNGKVEVSQGLKKKQALLFGFELLQKLVERHRRKPNKANGKELAVVFDIDGTAIFNYNSKGVQLHKRNATLYLIYNWCLENNVLVFFLTARPDFPENRESTVRDLTKSGYYHRDYEDLIMRPMHDYYTRGSNYSNYKASERTRLARFFKLLLNVGDTLLDMAPLKTSSGEPIAVELVDLFSSIDPKRSYIMILPKSVPHLNIKLNNEL